MLVHLVFFFGPRHRNHLEPICGQTVAAEVHAKEVLVVQDAVDSLAVVAHGLQSAFSSLSSAFSRRLTSKFRNDDGFGLSGTDVGSDFVV